MAYIVLDKLKENNLSLSEYHAKYGNLVLLVKERYQGYMEILKIRMLERGRDCIQGAYGKLEKSKSK